MPRASQTIKMKVHKGSNIIPKVESHVKGSGGVKARTVIKAKVHRQKGSR